MVLSSGKQQPHLPIVRHEIRLYYRTPRRSIRRQCDTRQLELCLRPGNRVTLQRRVF